MVRRLVFFCFVLGIAAASGLGGFYPKDRDPKPVFEGILHFSEKRSGSPGSFNYAIKEGKVRIDVSGAPGEQTIMIAEPALNKGFFLMPEQKSYFPFELYPATSPARAPWKKLPKINWTGKKKEILGYQCEQGIFSDNHGRVELWVTRSIGRFVRMRRSFRPEITPPRWVAELIPKGLFPFVIKETSPAGVVKSYVEVTRVERRSLKEEMFRPPETYRVFVPAQLKSKRSEESDIREGDVDQGVE